MATHSLSRSPSFDAGTFASAFVQAAGQENIVNMSLGGGGFVVAELCERLRQEGDAVMRNEVASWFEAKVRAELDKSTTKGKAVLLAKLNALNELSC
jgi:pumilio homology domain family member 6